MSVGPLKGKEEFVASPVCQKQRISFDKLCERMAEDSTVGDADVAAVFYKFRKVLNEYCLKGYIVDGDPLGTFRPTFSSKAVRKKQILSHQSVSRKHRSSSRLRLISAD